MYVCSVADTCSIQNRSDCPARSQGEMNLPWWLANKPPGLRGSGCGLRRRRLCPSRRFLQLLFVSSNSPSEWNLQEEAIPKTVRTWQLTTSRNQGSRIRHISKKFSDKFQNGKIYKLVSVGQPRWQTFNGFSGSLETKANVLPEPVAALARLVPLGSLLRATQMKPWLAVCYTTNTTDQVTKNIPLSLTRGTP